MIERRRLYPGAVAQTVEQLVQRVLSGHERLPSELLQHVDLNRFRYSDPH